jgi:hypothetical protein
MALPLFFFMLTSIRDLYLSPGMKLPALKGGACGALAGHHTLLPQGFGGLSADGQIRRSTNASGRELFRDILRIHPQA